MAGTPDTANESELVNYHQHQRSPKAISRIRVNEAKKKPGFFNPG
jgi:hypothetical protein